MSPRLSLLSRPVGGQKKAAEIDAGGGKGRDNGHAHQPALQGVKRGQREDKEANVAVKLGVFETKGLAVQPAENCVPLSRSDGAKDNGKE